MEIQNKIEEARRFFGVEHYPGNLFDILNTQEMIEEHKILVFKQDIDKLSGFIGYKNNLTMICINFNRNIGHQNFTLAHELGHMFLHPGKNMSDSNPQGAHGHIENEANEFASELIYPRNIAKLDLALAQEKNLFKQDNWEELAEYINNLSLKYCISFKFAFYKLTDAYFNNYREKGKYYSRFKKHIGVFRNRFQSFHHEVEQGHPYYRKMNYSYEYMNKLVNELIQKKELGMQTGEAILDKHKELNS